jgi:hypothetical protein
MNELSAEAWLTQEVDDLLDQGPVGLYQFVWGLRGTSFGLSDDEAIRLAIPVAARLVRSGRAAIYAVSWPGMDIQEGPLPIQMLNDPASWSEGESGPLMALLPTTATP